MKRMLAVASMVLTLSTSVYACEEGQIMQFTCYCPESCAGTITASGARVREGILASNREHLGDGAMLYLKDGTFLGFYECLDTGSGKGLVNGTAVDVWAPNLTKAKELMKLTEGRVMVIWIKNPKG